MTRLALLLLLTVPACLPSTPSKKKSSAKPASHSLSRTARRGHASKTAQPARQTAPSSDRYREIQEALAAKGYLKTPPTGVWDADSQDAMRRFQADQKLDTTGKISARSLLSLGLGPKESTPPQPPPEQSHN